ncbi:MAG: hypothetical protein JWR36_2876 [Glaciihabitans sp.]|nr:hypothetical protein [Glaciihabitans sp.]MDQ1570562.1 hypothetical protein [Actinomycetota bacterium]
MRFVFAIICFILAAASMGLGIAERTILAGPDHVSASTTSTDSSAVTIIDGSALNAYPHSQTVQLEGGSTAFAAYGRTSDVVAWVGDTTYTRVTFNQKTHKLVSRVHTGTVTSVPDPSGSDLWLGQRVGENARSFHLQVPTSVSVLAISNGISAAPPTVKITWPLDNSKPWSGPLIVAGAGVLLLGLILLLWAFTHLRRGRGPRRSQPRMPKLPRQPRYKPSRKAVTATKGRRSIARFVAVPTTVVGVSIALVGCSLFPTTPAPTATPSAKAAETSKLQPTAVTPVQLQRIMQRVSSVVATSDTTMNANLIATRVAGPALQDRLANYLARKKNPKLAPSTAIPSGSIDVTLPEAKASWPRTVFAVVHNTAQTKLAPVALMLVQDDPRSNYKVNYAITLQPKTVLPEVAPASVGTSRMSPDNKFLKIEPSALASAYGDILLKDAASPSYPLFQSEGDTFREQVGLAAHKAAQKKLPSTAKLAFANVEGSGQIIALATNNSGAIVAVNLNEIETVRPVKAGAAVSASGAIKALSGKATSRKGLVATYGDQLLFYVPRADQSGKIILLGYSQGLIDAKEYKK